MRTVPSSQCIYYQSNHTPRFAKCQTIRNIMNWIYIPFNRKGGAIQLHSENFQYRNVTVRYNFLGKQEHMHCRYNKFVSTETYEYPRWVCNCLFDCQSYVLGYLPRSGLFVGCRHISISLVVCQVVCYCKAPGNFDFPGGLQNIVSYDR